ncbi:MAG TPA: hypothetical protein VK691_00135 [Solirubrobacteraceae bacterium]|nr:hypothetical protein [Solirubrobacteraceae bacterium]
MPHRPTNARDAALRRLSTANRWLVAGSVAFTGIFAEVAAQAFPGKTLKASSTTRSPTHDTHKSSSSTTSKSLQPPAQAPEASSTPEPTAPHETPPPESAPSHGTAPSQESAPAQEAAPAKEAAPSQQAVPSHESAPAPEPAPAKEAAPSQETAQPVVSGGS